MRNEKDLTGEALRQLRKDLGKGLKEFWSEVNVTISAGHNYETGKRKLPPIVRRACYLHFVCGYKIDVAKPKEAAKLLRKHNFI